MKTFIGRKTELATLEQEYTRDSGFVVVYGRRRVGKTTLIKEFLKDKTAFYYLATKEVESQSMKRFAGVIARTTKNRMLNNVRFKDYQVIYGIFSKNGFKERLLDVAKEIENLWLISEDHII